jgi:FkbM family methyltransferase
MEPQTKPAKMLTWSNNLLKRVRTKIRPSLQLALKDPFVSPSEKELYRRIVATPESGTQHAPIVLHPACLGGHPVVCRPGTRDKSSLQDLLFHQVYLPPKPLRDPRVILDLGSNVGYTVAHLAFRYPSARIVGVELDSENYALALRNTEPWQDRVTLINAAIWSSDGYVAFGGQGEDAYRVLSPADSGANQASPPIHKRAKAVTIATLMRELDLPRIDYVKMDIEGGEAELVLKADGAWMDKVDAMKIELHNLDYRDFERVLTARGFHCYQDKREWTCIVAARAETWNG